MMKPYIVVTDDFGNDFVETSFLGAYSAESPEDAYKKWIWHNFGTAEMLVGHNVGVLDMSETQMFETTIDEEHLKKEYYGTVVNKEDLI